MFHRGLVFVCLVSAACATAPSKGSGGGSEPFSEQAKAGAALYVQHCAECHGDSGQGTDHGPRVVGLSAGALPLDPPVSREHRKGQFKTVMDVAAFAVKNMPANDPGTLKEEEYWRILAFDLKANGVDLGDKHLDASLAQTLTIPR
jgi:polar amino acid transport system substrate-binding protein